MTDFWMKKMRTYFIRVDFDHDNVVTKNDFQQMAARFVTEGQLNEERGNKLRDSLLGVWEKYWHHLGGNDRDSITQEQFLSAMKDIVACPNAREVIKKPLPCFFDAVDTNQDGQISCDEYVMFFRCMGIDESLAEESFKAIDTNHDNNLSLDEFVDAGMQFFLKDESTPASNLFWGPLV